MNTISNHDLFALAVQGARVAVDLAERSVQEAVSKYGPDHPVEYPETCYELPSVFAWDGRETKTLGQLEEIMASYRTKFTGDATVENALAAGEATMIAAEVIEALKYIDDARPYEGTEYMGFVPDKVIRGLGFAFVDDTIPGAAVLAGKSPDPDALVRIVRDLQSKGILIIASGEVIEQLASKGVQMGERSRLYPVGHGTQIVHALNFAIRAALSFGGVQRGDREGIASYLAKRPKVFVMEFGPLDPILAGAAFAAVLNGACIVTDQPVEGIPEKLIYVPGPENMVQEAIEARGIKVRLAPVDIPVAYGPAFEGEVVRRPDTYIEAGGAAKTLAFELLRLRPEDEIEDGKITVIGPDVDSLPEGGRTAIAILVDVYGRKMQEDFEGVLERRIHLFINYAEGAWHTGQRNILWIRLSRTAVAAGLRFRHFGDILITKLKEEFGNIVSRVQVTIITDEEEARKRLPEALDVYAHRDARLAGLTDEKVDDYYTCGLCESFAPGHVCIVTPERLGLCGAVNWLDARAAQEIDPNGPNKGVPKGECLDEVKGQWRGVNDAVYEATHHRIERFNAYTMMEDPMTSCGCFEVIVAMTADVQAVIAVNREYAGMTPIGMKFSSLAGSVGGGRQTPGFIGIGRKYITSRKFIPADGGFLRIAWMPRELKEAMRDALQKRAEELGEPDFVDKIADETITTEADGLTEWMMKVDHPALRMPPLLS
ncbi:MAG: CO dehydrogenase/CO-methylating acetyl-CoA synthase complex subunit beta [Methanomassiliicoccus sp.]|nr:CO dehydrogenase/CO-methylating acetyl-CoA synthase complex subunit beta [Methanomassiliicoccus sp.]